MNLKSTFFSATCNDYELNDGLEVELKLHLEINFPPFLTESISNSYI